MSSFRCISYDYLSLNPVHRDRVVNLHRELEQALAEALAPPAPEPAPSPAPEPSSTQEEPASRPNRRTRRVTSNLNTILRDGEEFFINTCNLEWVFTWHTDTSSFIYNGVSYTTPLSICRAHARAHGAENPGNGYDFILRKSDGMTLGEIYDASI